jgi:TPR repeat protein
VKASPLAHIFTAGLLASGFASAQTCQQAGDTYLSGTYICTDELGQQYIGDGLGRPLRDSQLRQRQKAPIVYGDPFGAIMRGQQAGADIAAKREQNRAAERENNRQDLIDSQRRREAQLQRAQADLDVAQQAQQNERMRGRQALILPPNMKGKLAVIEAGAKNGDAQGQAILGAFYWYGANVPRSAEIAVKWFMKAAAQGESTSQDSLALAYGLGEGAAQDSVLAYAWWNLAAAQGNEHAARNLQEVGSILTQAQIAEAQRLSSNWKPGTLVEREGRTDARR